MPRPDAHQFRLFDDSPTARAMEIVQPAQPSPALVADGAALRASRPGLRLGTSSWSFPGWKGLVYTADHREADLARSGLAAYASHPLMRTVGLDRAFYQPLSVDQYADLAAQTPEDFRFLIKCHQAVTRPDADERGRTFGDTAALREAGVANPLFLDAAYAIDRVIGPTCVGLKSRAGPIVFQFPPLDLAARGPFGGAARFIERVDRFLGQLPRAGSGAHGLPLYAVEFRNGEPLGRADDAFRKLADMLRAHNVAYGWVAHPSMPTLSEQRAALAAAGLDAHQQPHLTLRWLLRRGLTYEGARDAYAPFNRHVDDDAATRNEIAALVDEALGAGRNAWVIVNNKAEGSGPLSIERIAARLRAEGRAGGAA